MAKTWVILLGIAVGFVPILTGGKDPLMILMSFFGLLIALFLVSRRQEGMVTAGRPTRWLTLGLLGWSTLSLLWSVNRYQTEQWVLYLVLGIISWYLVRLLSRAEQYRLQSIYLAVAVLVGLYGIYLFELGEYNRLTSTFYWANPAAAFMLPAIILSIGRIVTTGRRRYVALSTLCMLIFLLTYSRGAILVLGVIAVASLLLIRPLRRNWVILVFISILAISLSMIATTIRTKAFHHGAINTASRFSEAATGESTSVKDRLIYLQDAGDVWLSSPLIGTGAGTFGTVHPQHQKRVISAATSAHNIYIQTLAELGIVGFALLIWLVVMLLAGMARGVFSDLSRLPAAIASVALLMHFGLDIDQRYPALIVLMAVLIASAYQGPRRGAVHGWRRLGVPALLVVAIAFAISNYQSSVWAARGAVLNDNRDFTNAATAYSRAHTGLMYDPDQWTAEGIDDYTLAALTNGSKSYNMLAIDRASQAIARDPKDSQHYLLKARTERLTHEYAAAEADYHRALALDGLNHPEYYADLAELKLLQGDSEAAQTAVSKGLSLYPPSVVANRSTDPLVLRSVSELYTIRALDELSKGDAARGQADLDRALLLDPRDVVAIKLKRGITQVKQLIAP